MNAHRFINGLIFECLEPRQMLTVSLDSNGWYNVTPAADTRIVYVSSSTGSDLNDGLSAATPLQTIGAGKNLIRDGSADWLLLKRGDTFGSGLGTWTRSGRSGDEPILIGAYGDGDRPLLNTGTNEGILTLGGNPISNLAIDGLHFFANGYTGSNGGYQTAGLRFLREGSNYLIQDVKVEGYKDNIVLQGDGAGLTNVELNRVISLDAYNVGNVGNGHAQGLYAWEFTNGLTVERSVFDHNGWKEGVAAATVFNHDLYINTGAQNVVVRNNIISRGANNGLLLRAGGTVLDNLFIRNSVGAIVDHTASTLTGNVVLESMSVPGLSQGVGFNIEGVPSALVSNNIIAHDSNSGTTNISGIAVNSGAGNVIVQNNTTYDWRNEINNGGNRKITIRDNAVQHPTSGTSSIMQNRYAINTATYFYSNNIYSSPRSKPFRINGVDVTPADWLTQTQETNAQFQKLAYVDPTRSIGSYNTTIGGDATTEAFLDAARNQSTSSWSDNLGAAAVIQYIRAGFAASSATGQIMGGVYSDFLGDGKRDSFDTQLGAGITIYLDLDNDGHRQGNEPTTTTDSSGSYSFSNLADGTYFVRIIPPNGTTQSGPTNGAAIQVIIAGGATYAGRDFGVMQPAPPIRVAAQFNPDNALLITLAFNADVSASLDRDDLKVVNLTTGTNTDMSAFTFNESLAGPSTLATWSATSLADGNYRITLPAGSVSAGNDSLSADYTYDFFVLNADGDRNRTVNILDFNILATNFGKTGQTFSQGNYNYSTDGRVDINDFNVLAGNFGKHLDPLTTAQSVTAQPTAAISNSTVTTAAALQSDDQRVADLVLA